FLHEKFPNLSPNAITSIGLVSVVLGGYLAERENRKPERNKLTMSVSVVLEAIGFTLDAFDGAVAKAIEEDTPGKRNKLLGKVFDIVADRTQEIILAGLRSESAYKRG